jgi:hypothetical protein
MPLWRAKKARCCRLVNLSCRPACLAGGGAGGLRWPCKLWCRPEGRRLSRRFKRSFLFAFLSLPSIIAVLVGFSSCSCNSQNARDATAREPTGSGHVRPWSSKPRQRDLMPVLRRPVEPAIAKPTRLTQLGVRQASWQRIGGGSPLRGRFSQPPRPRVMHEVLLARAAVKRSQGRPRAKY